MKYSTLKKIVTLKQSMGEKYMQIKEFVCKNREEVEPQKIVDEMCTALQKDLVAEDLLGLMGQSCVLIYEIEQNHENPVMDELQVQDVLEATQKNQALWCCAVQREWVREIRKASGAANVMYWYRCLVDFFGRVCNQYEMKFGTPAV